MLDQTSGGRFDPAETERSFVDAGRQMAAAFSGIGEEVDDYEIRVVRVHDGKRRRRAAGHETGHAVVAVIADLGFAGSTLDPDFTAGSATKAGPAVDQIQWSTCFGRASG